MINAAQLTSPLLARQQFAAKTCASLRRRRWLLVRPSNSCTVHHAEHVWRHVTNLLSPLRQQVLPVLCAAIVLLPSTCIAEPLLTSKPTFATDYASVVRKREGKTKSSLPSAREAEALLEINEDLFTIEALEGMSRCVFVPACSALHSK